MVGNDNVQKSIIIVQETATKITEAVFLAFNNLRSVAKNFEVLDQTVV